MSCAASAPFGRPAGLGLLRPERALRELIADLVAPDLAQWTQRLLDRYFAEACLRESLRIRHETVQRQR